MPKETVDYSNTIIYKIYCKDSSITDMYVGHTTNFIQRKHTHKYACNNLKNNLKIYQVIRCNGGWENWDMVEIAKYFCKDATEARIKEHYHYEELKASLNSSPPYTDKLAYFCSKCNLQCLGPTQYKQHIACNKHVQNICATNATENMPSKFTCGICDYKCSKKSSWDQHLATSKHLKAKNGLTPAIQKYACENCDKIFKHHSSYSRHKKNCIDKPTASPIENPSNNILDKDLIMMLVKQNTELMEMLKNNNTNQIINNTNCMNNNKTFNLQFFLNETCKDAMNIMDFVDSIKLQLTDLEKVGELGYVEGISSIITTNLKALDVSLRPVHCTDKKRETIYIKDENQWAKEDDNKTKLRKAIKKVANNNIRLLPQYREKNPKYSDSSSRVSDKYDKMVIQVMGGLGNNDLEKEDKIIHNISKTVVIDKYD
jgi:hypothetical protein